MDFYPQRESTDICRGKFIYNFDLSQLLSIFFLKKSKLGLSVGQKYVKEHVFGLFFSDLDELER